MKANTARTISAAELDNLQMVYGKELIAEGALMPAAIRGSVVTVRTANGVPAMVSRNPLTGAPLTPRDRLHVLAEAALNCLGDSESVLGYLEGLIQRLSAQESAKAPEERTLSELDLNYARLKGLYGDLQRADMVKAVGDYDKYKEIAAQSVEFLAKECREYVTNTVGKKKSMETGLEPSDQQIVQAFNHLRRVLGSVFKLPVEDGEVYLDGKVTATESLDDTERGGMNRAFAGFTYYGNHKPVYMQYMPYYIMTMYSSMFIQALSRPRQLNASTTRPGPLEVPRSVALRYGLPEGVKLTHNSVSRYGETNQRGYKNPKQDHKRLSAPMRFYYSYEENGVTKVLSMNRSDHFFIQLRNRPSMQIPAGTIPDLHEEVSAQYVMYDNRAKPLGYAYDVKVGSGTRRYGVTQAQHQKILQHNAKLVDVNDPNGPVHLSFMADGSLDTVMNRLFNKLAARAISDKTYVHQMIPSVHRDSMKLMRELTEQIRPAFEREQKRVEAIRTKMFEDFANGTTVDGKVVDKDLIEDTCRKEALRSFRSLIGERRRGVDVNMGRKLMFTGLAEGGVQHEAVTTILDRLYDNLYKEHADSFAKMAALRYLKATKREPFYAAIKTVQSLGHSVTPGVVLNDAPPEVKRVFDAVVAQVREKMEEPGGFRDQLRSTFWGGATQALIDVHFGPEGILRSGEYVTDRKELPKNSREFREFVEKQAPEMLADPIQLGNRLRKTFAYFEFNVSPHFKLPWPNLYRSNDLMRSRPDAQNKYREQRTVKPTEPAVDLSVEMPDSTKPVLLTGPSPRPTDRVFVHRPRKTPPAEQPVAPSVGGID